MANTTEMIDFEMWRDRPNKKFISVTMSKHICPDGWVEQSIAIASSAANPQPAGFGFVYLGPKPIFNGYVLPWGSHNTRGIA